MLNVFLNTHTLLDYHRTGIPHYTWQLFNAMSRHPAIKTLYTLRGSRLMKYYPGRECSHNPRVDKIFNLLEKTPFLKHLISKFTYHHFDKFARHHGNSNIVYFEPNFIVNEYKGPCITTLHDLTCLRFPHFQPDERVRWFKQGLTKTLAQATHIISVSEFTRREAIQYLGVAPQNITTVHNGVSDEFHPRTEADIHATLQKYQLNYKNYLLSVSTLEPRKNLESLVQAYLSLSPRLQEQYPLILVGAIGWKVQDLLSKVKTAQHIQVLGYVSHHELPQIFAGAKAFSYVSTYEGFGLPVLEALASGVPVLTSADSAMAEFSSKHALLVNPLDIDAICASLSELLLSSERAEQTLAAADYYRQQFSWQNCVEQTIAVLNAHFGSA